MTWRKSSWDVWTLYADAEKTKPLGFAVCRKAGYVWRAVTMTRHIGDFRRLRDAKAEVENATRGVDAGAETVHPANRDDGL